MSDIRKLQKEIHKNAIDKGFYDSINLDNIPREVNIAKWICLMHSELSEAMESVRNNIPEGEKGCLSEEFADCIIRILDTCEYLGIDIQEAIEKKMAYNKKREYKHGKKF